MCEAVMYYLAVPLVYVIACVMISISTKESLHSVRVVKSHINFRHTAFTEKFKESSLQKFSRNFSHKFIKSSLQDSKSTRVFVTNPDQSPYRADSMYVVDSRDSDHSSNSNQSDRSSDGKNSGLARLSVRDDSFTDLRESLLEP